MTDPDWRLDLAALAVAIVLFALALATGCAAPSRLGLRSVSVCVEYARERGDVPAARPEGYNGRRAGASTCAEFSQ